MGGESRHGRCDGAQSTLREAVARRGAGSGGGRIGGAVVASLVRMMGLGRVAWLAAVATAMGCGEPVADVVAVWVDAVADDDGDRTVRLYEAGERGAISIVPDIPGSGIELLQVGVDARGRGVALSGTDETAWIDRRSGRRVSLSAEGVGRLEVMAPTFSFTRSGDGLLRALEVDAALPPVWLLAPLSGPASLRVHLVGPPTVASDARQWVILHAADAPVLVWAEVRGRGTVDGQVLALAYPSDDGEGPWVDDLRPLARGTLRTGTRTVAGEGCPHGVCPSPSGRVLYALVDEHACDLWRWTWVGAASTASDTAAEPVALPCPGEGTAQLLAALDDDRVVLDDGLRLHLVELPAGPGAAATGEVEPVVRSVPRPTGELAKYLVAHGHALVVSSAQGEVARVDAHGPRLVSGTQSVCVQRDGFAVSPGGAWVIQSCNARPQSSIDVAGHIQRISVLGTELYAGVPMRPIAIDDEGNALLYSIDVSDSDGVPRGLFVLTGDGQLTRVDELEPYPGLVMLHGPGGEAVPGRFAGGPG
jgi:hypothetical protein